MAKKQKGEISCPMNDADVPRFLAETAKHRDSIEYRIRVTGLLAEVTARGARAVTQWSQLRHGSVSHDSKKRRELHLGIVDTLLVEESKCDGESPQAVILLGPPGAGKTSIGVPLANDTRKVVFSSVNPDDVKERLPEYEGWNASALHEESSFVSESMTKTTAITDRYNIIYDITGKRHDKVKGAIEELDYYGYDVHLVLIQLAPWQAVCRVWRRFQENPFGRTDGDRIGSRYVDPNYVYNVVKDFPEKTFNALKNHPAIRGYCCVDSAASMPGNLHILQRKGW
jgi:predicted ABC-type ATPase